jgi:DNA-binding transcriptional ArsR family regulator
MSGFRIGARLQRSIAVVRIRYFVYHHSMNALTDHDVAVSEIAGAIGEPARARILYSLLDGHARTSTELAIVAEVTPSTASVHLNRLREAHLVRMAAQGRHRYYSLAGKHVATALEGLSVLAGRSRKEFVPNTPLQLRAARTCYDHIAGRLGVLLHNHFKASEWISARGDAAYEVTPKGTKQFAALGIDFAAIRSMRRKFAYPCLDWSERQPHIGGAFGAALLNAMLKLRWVSQDLDSRCLQITGRGRREMTSRFGIDVEL